MAINHQNKSLLKPLLDSVPAGFMVDTPWLKARGIDSKSIHNYVARGWLERVIRGVYRRPLPESAEQDDEASWAIPLLSLQRLMKCAVHLGAESALDMTGYGHYLYLGGRSRIQCYGEVPTWLKRLPIKTQIVVRRRTLFGDSSVGIDDVNLKAGASRSMVGVWHWPLKTSSPERAILEALDELPRNTTFEHLDKIFEGLVTLRPQKLATLLADCRSVKVRRLFFVFADKHRHAWRKDLDISEIDFGSGPRALTEGGRLHPDYRIYVPSAFLPDNLETADNHA